MKGLFLLLTLAVFSNGLVGKSFGAEEVPSECHEALESFHSEGASEAFTRLQSQGERAFVDASVFNNKVCRTGGGPCAPVTGFNALQGLRRMLGYLSPLDPESTILEIFKKNAYLKKGRVTNEELEQLLHTLEIYLPGYRLDIHSAPASSDSSQMTALLKMNENEVKILTHTVYVNGTYAGRHFIILKEVIYEGERVKRIITVDPNAPSRNYIYELEGSTLPRTETAVWKLRRPGTTSSIWQFFTLDRVFSATLKPETSQ